VHYRIQNMTATCDFGFPIRLEAFLYAHSTNATFEPELFPGLIYRMTDPKVVLLIFVSGKVVVTGAKSEKDVSDAINNIHEPLLEFRKRNLIVRGRKA
jgi:transcription initiation factor TFIID TATA-box-binding protein